MSDESQQDTLVRDWLWRHVEKADGQSMHFAGLWTMYKKSHDKPVPSLLMNALHARCIIEFEILDKKSKLFIGYKFKEEVPPMDQIYPEAMEAFGMTRRNGRLRPLVVPKSVPGEEHKPHFDKKSPELEKRRKKRTAKIIRSPPGDQQAVDMLNRNKPSRIPTVAVDHIPPPDNLDDDGDDNDFPIRQPLQSPKRRRTNPEEAIAGGGPAPPLPALSPPRMVIHGTTQSGKSSARKRKRHPSKEDFEGHR